MENRYLTKLINALNTRINELAEQIKGAGNTEAKVPPMPMLLKTALKNEWETTLLTSHWVTDERDPDFRIALARLAGDEAKHFAQIERFLKQNYDIGISTEELDERTPLFRFLTEQKSTFDRVVTGPFTRELLAVARNNVFMEHCREINEEGVIALYQEIQADEKYHHELGMKYIAKYLTSETEYQNAEKKMLAMLKVVDDIQEMAVMKKGVCKLPGC